MIALPMWIPGPQPMAPPAQVFQCNFGCIGSGPRFSSMHYMDVHDGRMN